MEVDEEVDSLSILGEHLINTILADEPIETIKSIIDNGSPLWFQNEEEGMSPLHAAAYMQNPELARFLIEQGAVWNASESKMIDCQARLFSHPSLQWTSLKTLQGIYLYPLTTQKHIR